MDDKADGASAVLEYESADERIPFGPRQYTVLFLISAGLIFFFFAPAFYAAAVGLRWPSIAARTRAIYDSLLK